jgi:hypothetical protein
MAEKMDLSSIYQDESPSLEDALAFAIDAVDRGDIPLGCAALEWVLQREPENKIAWLWMACTLPDEHAKRECYIQIDL